MQRPMSDASKQPTRFVRILQISPSIAAALDLAHSLRGWGNLERSLDSERMGQPPHRNELSCDGVLLGSIESFQKHDGCSPMARETPTHLS